MNIHYTKNDFIFVVFMTAVIAMLSTLLCNNLNSRIKSSQNYKPVGVVKYKRHVVMRKYSDRFVWENVKPQTKIFMYDSILTKDKSDAEIILNSGTKLGIDSRTMIEVIVQEGHTSISLHKGVLSAQNNSGEKLFIKTLDGNMLTIDKADALLSLDGKKLSIDVRSGNIAFSSSDGKSQTFNQGDLIEIEGNQISKSETAIFGLSPENNSIVQLENKNVTFSWQKNSKIKNYIFSIDTNPSFTSKYKKQYSVSENSFQLKLPMGKWYWKVKSKISNNKISSSTNVIENRKQNNIKVFSPKYNEKITSNKESTNVLFSWEKKNISSETFFTLANNEKLKPVLVKRKVIATSINIKNLKKGDYYWSVENNINKSKHKPTVHKFVIAKTKNDVSNPSNVNRENLGEENINKKKVLVSKTIKTKSLFKPTLLKSSLNYNSTSKSKKVSLLWRNVANANNYILVITRKSGKKLYYYRGAKNGFQFTPKVDELNKPLVAKIKALTLIKRKKVAQSTWTIAPITIKSITPISPPIVLKVLVR